MYYSTRFDEAYPGITSHLERNFLAIPKMWGTYHHSKSASHFLKALYNRYLGLGNDVQMIDKASCLASEFVPVITDDCIYQQSNKHENKKNFDSFPYFSPPLASGPNFWNKRMNIYSNPSILRCLNKSFLLSFQFLI